MLDEIKPENNIEENYKNYFLAYVNMKSGLFSTRDSLHINDLVHGCSKKDGEVVHHARVLHRVLYKDFETYFDACNDVKVSRSKITESNNRIFEIYPNPNNGIMTVDYQMEVEETGKLIIHNLMGNKINEYDLISGQGSVNIQSKNLRDGVYLCSFIVNNTIMETKRIVILK